MLGGKVAGIFLTSRLTRSQGAATLPPRPSLSKSSQSSSDDRLRRGSEPRLRSFFSRLSVTFQLGCERRRFCGGRAGRFGQMMDNSCLTRKICLGLQQAANHESGQLTTTIFLTDRNGGFEGASSSIAARSSSSFGILITVSAAILTIVVGLRQSLETLLPLFSPRLPLMRS